MLLTIFTPTYNRAYRLTDLYESLKNQSHKDFEWIIVDDGSTDNTKELIAGWITERIMPIRYFYTENGGKHRAINRGVIEAHGELFFIVDSDDYLSEDALEIIIRNYKSISNNNNFAGLSGLRAYPNGTKVGGEEDWDVIDCNSIDFRYKYKVKGDMAEVFKTSVLKEFPFPEINGEKFCPEALVWNRISQKHKIRYIYHKIYICEYLPDGLTSTIIKVRRNSPIASSIYYSELSRMNIPTIQKIKAAINYWRFRTRDLKPGAILNPSLSIIGYIPGNLMRFLDKRRL